MSSNPPTHHGPVACFSGQHISRIDVLVLDGHLLAAPHGESPRVLQHPESPHVLALDEHWAFAIRQRVTVSPAASHELIRLWNGLPEDEQARCHDPAYALQFWLHEQLVFSASLCWACNNVRMAGPMASASWREFDGSSVPANALLRMCQRLTA